MDVMLASYESVVQDISALQTIRWDALVLDLRLVRALVLLSHVSPPSLGLLLTIHA